MRRTPGRRGRTATLLVVATLGALCLGAFVLTPNRSTTFAPGLERGNFREVSPGLPAARVREMLGQPLAVDVHTDGVEIWHYAQPGETPEHMVRRSVVIDRETERVISVEDRTHWDPIGHVRGLIGS